MGYVIHLLFFQSTLMGAKNEVKCEASLSRSLHFFRLEFIEEAHVSQQVPGSGRPDLTINIGNQYITREHDRNVALDRGKFRERTHLLWLQPNQIGRAHV